MTTSTSLARRERRGVPTLPVSIVPRARSRSPLRGWPWKLSGASVSTVGLLAAVLTPLPSYSSWSTAPHAVTRAQERALAEECHASGPTLVDARGRTAVLLEASPRSGRACFTTMPAEKEDGAGGGAVIAGPKTENLKADGAEGTQMWHVHPDGRPGGAHAATILAAHLDPSVVQADVVTPVGNVRASVRQGVVLAWWPGHDERGVVITGRARDGRVVSQVVLP